MVVLVDVSDPAIRTKLQANGIRWRLKHSNGTEKLELSDEQAAAAGLSGAPSTSEKVSASLKADGPVADQSGVQPPKGRLFGTGNRPKGSKE